MASIVKRGDSWRVHFRFQGQQHAISVGKISKSEASLWQAKVDEKLLRIRQGLIDVPPGIPITDFIMRDGKQQPVAASATFEQLRAGYIAARSNGSLEANTLATVQLHLSHIEGTLGKRFLLSGLSHQHLQDHINRRAKETVKAIDQKRAKLDKEARKKCPSRHVSAVTIRKEINTFRQAWLWGVRSGLIKGAYPAAGLSYPRVGDVPPFMTWAEIERRIKSGGDESLWECLYLTSEQVVAILDHLQQKESRPWVYPLIASAALTGARRSELIRATPSDVDMEARVLTIREKKRAKGRETTRRVPMTERLVEAITPLMEGRKFLFGDGQKPMNADKAKQLFRRLFKGTKWKVVRGYHVFRHSFISILASRGTDQRIIDDLVGHSTEQQRRRYRHLFPQVKKDAITSAFG